MKIIILFLIMFTTLSLTAQTKMETFCLENGLTTIVTKDNYTVAKHTFTEQATMLLATYDYTIEATYKLTETDIKLMSIKNTFVSNSGFVLDFDNYRGGLKENITKKSWEKLKGNINKRCQTLIDKYNGTN